MQGDKPINNQHNAILYLGRNVDSILPDLAHNEMTHRDEWRGGEVTDATLVLTRAHLERLGLKSIGKELVDGAVLTVARYRQFHPVRDFLAITHDADHETAARRFGEVDASHLQQQARVMLAATLKGARYVEARYEDLVRDPEATLRRIKSRPLSLTRNVPLRWGAASHLRRPFHGYYEKTL